MNHIKSKLTPGIWFVGVPIGTARDITLRALDVLASADVLVAEDSRSLRKLMEIHGVPLDGRKVAVLHDHSARDRALALVDLAGTHSVAYASEAGMPGIADPGFELSRAAQNAGVKVTCAPGPSASLTALAVSGMATDAFFFAGFLPNRSAARQSALETVKSVQATLIFYESPNRLSAMLADAARVLGPDRHCVICRELTKRFEETQSGALGEMSEVFSSQKPKGELVVLIARQEAETVSDDVIDEALRNALHDMSLKDAAAFVAETYDVPKRHAYQRALALSRD